MVKLPEPFASIPRQPLLFPWPSAIEPLDRLTTQLTGAEAGATRIFVSREDTNSGLGGSGGNKLRKLEYGQPHSQLVLVTFSTGRLTKYLI